MRVGVELLVSQTKTRLYSNANLQNDCGFYCVKRGARQNVTKECFCVMLEAVAINYELSPKPPKLSKLQTEKYKYLNRKTVSVCLIFRFMNTTNRCSINIDRAQNYSVLAFNSM